MAANYLLILTTVLLAASVECQNRPAYVKPCRANDAKLTQCFIGSIHHLRPYVSKGIPEIQMPAIEPYRLDELSLTLTSGPQGYKITLRNMDIYGISNYTVNKLKLSKKGAPQFEVLVTISELNMNAEYKSSGVLLILPASGSGIFHNTMRDVSVLARGTVSFHQKKNGEIMRVDSLSIDLDCKSTAMRIDNAFANQPILREATNLFLKENGKEVLTAMSEQLNTKLAARFRGTANTMLKNTPINQFYINN